MSIYLDSASMAKPLPCALEAYRNAPFGNPSSEHAMGIAARNALEQAREKIAGLVSCNPSELYFCSTATEAAAWVMNSMYTDRRIVLASPFEHHAISENVLYPPFTVEPNCSAIAQQHSNNETGEILNHPVLEQGALFICDATSSIGHVPLEFRDPSLGFTYMGFMIADGIKFGSVPGAAFLVAKEGAPLFPLIQGGGQERGMRSGTENVPAICAMAAALEWQIEHMQENTAHIGMLRATLVKMLSEIPGHQWNTPFDKPCVPHILNISFDGVDAHVLTLLLSEQGVMISAGAACSNGLNEPSHVIMAMYHDEARARSAVRISLSHENTMDEIVEAGEKIKEAVAHIRKIGV